MVEADKGERKGQKDFLVTKGTLDLKMSVRGRGPWCMFPKAKTPVRPRLLLRLGWSSFQDARTVRVVIA